MVPDDIEREAHRLERIARSAVHVAAHDMDAAERHAMYAAHHHGRAYGLAFRAAELRYDARGGMTAALERRRFEPGARWLCRGIVFESYGHDLEQPWMVRLQACIFGCIESQDDMTPENGWRFLGLPGGYR